MVKRGVSRIVCILLFCSFLSCKKGGSDRNGLPAPPDELRIESISIEGHTWTGRLNGIPVKPDVKINFSAKVDLNSLPNGIVLTDENSSRIMLNFKSENDAKTILAVPESNLRFLSRYTLSINNKLTSAENVPLREGVTRLFQTGIDSSDKFSRVSDEELLTIIQRQTFRYFYDFAHPVSGMARERNSSGDEVTTGGTGFGVMALLVGIHRSFISRQEGLRRIATITDFLKKKCEKYHGAFAHWVNGNTGATVPFSEKDNGGDLVETSLLMQGLLCARQYFDRNSSDEIQLRNDINELWDGIDWNRYRNGQNVLYWHWSNQFGFAMNLKIEGWNESLITYVLAASSRTNSIDKKVYDEGWTRNGNFKNGNNYLGVRLPLGLPMGGPLFIAHYSFLGIDPRGLKDAYADYFEQNRAHSLINQKYCADNPKQFYGYSPLCWGLTAGDDNESGYGAHSPTNDVGVVSPTAAVSSLPYVPDESMATIRFFYYTLGDKLFKDYGFMDGFNLTDLWFSNSFLAIDQGPQIIMIENYRSGLLWNLFMSCPEVKTGMNKLGFSSPHL